MNIDREAITTENIAANCTETLEGIHADHREELLELTREKSQNKSTWAEFTDTMQDIASSQRMPTSN